MNVRPSILCPIDLSEASAGALRYAAALADHFVTRLIVLSVEDPLLTTAIDLGTGAHWSREESVQQVARFVSQTFGADAPAVALCEYDVTIGKPALEIVRLARERSCDLIVISTHGLTGFKKFHLGSTTERVLRDTTVPVLITPPVDPGAVCVDDARRLIGRIVVPVDLSPASWHQTQVARGVAEALDVPLILVHVIEPAKHPLLEGLDQTRPDADRRAAAANGLLELQSAIPSRLRSAALIAVGDPAEEAAKVVRDHHAGLVVMGLHGSSVLGPRMGSVTYRMFCWCPTLMLALPPRRVVDRNREAVAPIRQPA